MGPDGLVNGKRGVARVLVAMMVGVCAAPPARADPPQVIVDAMGARIRIVSATLAEVIDALARVAGFRVTYESSRPGAKSAP